VLQRSTGEWPKQVTLQTRTLDYPQQYWVRVEQLEEHWRDTRVDASVDGNTFTVTTKNVALLALHTRPLADPKGKVTINIDGQKVEHQARNAASSVVLKNENGRWKVAAGGEARANTLRKAPDLQGPIDDAFTRPFVVVTPSKPSKNPRFQAWMEFELAHFRNRWRALMRGDFVEKKDSELTQEDRASKNLILWGDADSNSVIKELSDGPTPRLPFALQDGQWVIGQEKYDAATHVPVFIYPYAGGQKNDVVLNSGLTFREAHDRTNSLQNPKLPDWAVVDITEPPSGTAPGKVVNAGFFDEEWKLKPPPK
jgi:hypothetical protein